MADDHSTTVEELKAEVAALRQALAAAEAREAATSEVLRTIASSPTSLQPVLDAVAKSATRLSHSSGSAVSIREGNFVRIVARAGVGSSYDIGDLLDLADRHPGHVATLEGRTIHIPDRSIPEFRAAFPATAARSVASLHVPLMASTGCIGNITVGKDQAVPYRPHEIALMEAFADQAVIAIENARLFSELQASNRELTETLEQQTATAEILRAIASVPLDLRAILNTIARSAARLTSGNNVSIWRRDGDTVRLSERWQSSGVVLTDEQVREHVRPLTRDIGVGRVILDGTTIRIDDVLDANYDELRHPGSRDLQQLTGYRSAVSTPLVQAGVVIGAISVTRDEVRPFDDRDLALVEGFANQAVIAIENARLFEELQQSNRQVTAALEQQTATAEVLRVIASSPTDLPAVLHAIVHSAAPLIGADYAAAFRAEDDLIRVTASTVSGRVGGTQPFVRGTLNGRAMIDGVTVHAHGTEAEHRAEFPESRMFALGFQVQLVTPLMRRGVALGSLLVARYTRKPFAEHEIRLLESFADQAVIAIENARLFEELQASNRGLSEALEQQTVTGEVLRVIAASPTDLQSVLNTIVVSAARLCDAPNGTIWRVVGDHLMTVAALGQRPPRSGRCCRSRVAR